MKKSLLGLWSLAALASTLVYCTYESLGTEQPLGSMRLAVTVDDLPTHGGLLPGTSRLDMTRSVLSALKDNGVPQAYGFANGTVIGAEPGLINVLIEWLKAGYPLGNHTYSHANLNQIAAPAYIADIAKMDSLIQTLAPVSPLIERSHVYRYPYLAEGETLQKRDAIRSYLFKNGYRIAEVTIDYSDWAWNAAYVRCANQHDNKSIAWLKAHVVDDAELHLREAKGLAELLFNRDIAQILLVHDGIFDAVMLGTILRTLRAQGTTFITLDEALADPAYKINPNYAFDSGLTFLEQMAGARNVDIDAFTDTTFTVDRLNEVCKQAAAK